MPIKDPYQVLLISSTATETEIKKAYRQLALKLHPDKQKGTLTDSQREALDKQFHDVKDARSFLLDSDHAEGKRKYDANLASERVRHKEEERRENTMSSRRKRMREELGMRERMAKTAAAGGRGAAAASASSEKDRFDVERLRREGERLRQEYSNREAEVDIARKQRAAVERATQKLHKEDRQIRLKWSRKKVTGGIHTKQSLTSIMQDFGGVEEVEMLGSKGNAALITFVSVSSCKQCVDAYRTSDIMRATFVGRRKVDDSVRGETEEDVPLRNSQNKENLEERNLRQAAERERLMRQMEMEENGGDADDDRTPSQKQTTSKSASNDRWGKQVEQRKSLFPPNFPSAPENEGLAPFDLLEKYEKIIFGKFDQ